MIFGSVSLILMGLCALAFVIFMIIKKYECRMSDDMTAGLCLLAGLGAILIISGGFTLDYGKCSCGVADNPPIHGKLR